MEIYSGCGNTFVITKYQQELDNKEVAKKICKDIYDGFILVRENPLEMIIYNQDGSIANMCGNGMRCFICYCYKHNIITNKENTVLIDHKLINTKIVSNDPFMVYVSMNKETYGFMNDNEFIKEIEVNNHKYKVYCVNTGVDHGILIPTNYDECIDDIELIYNSKTFIRNINLDIVKISDVIINKTYERGIGFTKACGTGAIATFLVLSKLNIINQKEIEVHVDGGIIKAGLDENGPYILGPAVKIK